jgi:hypothetical protein
MDESIAGIDRQPKATPGNQWSAQRPLALLGVAPPPLPPTALPASVIAGASFSQTLQFAAQASGMDDQDIADAICICKGYMSRFMRGVGQQWARRLVAFMHATNSLAPLQWMADQMGCDVVLRDSRAAEVAALKARLQELEKAA